MQYSMQFPLQRDYSQESYIVSSYNNHIYDVITNFHEKWGVKPYPKALIIIGQKSSGKTHLAHIWSKISGAEFFLTSGDYKGNLIIDDIENHEPADLLHSFNRQMESGNYLLMTASSTPNFTLMDLQSRLNATNIIHLERPDDEMVRVLLAKSFSEMSLKIPADVVEYIARRINRDFHSIQDFAFNLNLFSMQQKRKITIPMVREFLEQN